VLRKGQPVAINLELLPPPQPGKDDVRNLSGEHPFDGARVSNILPSLSDEMGLDQNEGVVVLSVRQGSVAARLGFQPGDIIASVQEAKIANVAGLGDVLDGKRQRLWVVDVVRAGKTLQLRVPG
jgi:S1-C subfamily serine protease